MKGILTAGILIAGFFAACTKQEQRLFPGGKIPPIPVHYIDSLTGSFSTAEGTCCGVPVTTVIPGTNFIEPGEGLGDEISWDVVGTPPTSYFYIVKPAYYEEGFPFIMDTTWQLLNPPVAQQGKVQIGFLIRTDGGIDLDSVYVKAIYTYPQFPGYEDSVTLSGVFNVND